jgi:hypothetical protein
VVAYVAAFLLLPAGPYAPAPGNLRRVIGLVLVPFWMVVLAGDNRVSWIGFDRPIGVALVLVGVALALWKPRRAGEPVSRARAMPAPAVVVTGRRAEPLVGAVAEPAPRPVRRPRPPASPLGRITLGAALLAAAVGTAVTAGSNTGIKVSFALAAVLCGVGLLVGTRYGRGRWLIVPAALFATGSVLGAATEGLGVHQDWSGPDTSWSAYDRPATPPPKRIDKGAGDTYLQLDGIKAPVDGVIRVGHGEVTIAAPDTVHLEVRARVGIGEIDFPDQSRSGYRRQAFYRSGPSDGPVARYDIAVGFGRIHVSRYSSLPAPPAPQPAARLPAGAVASDDEGGFVYEDGTRQLADGTILLPDGTQVLPDGSRLIASGARVLANGDVLLVDGAVIGHDGTVRLPSGVVLVARPPGGGSSAPTTATTAPAAATSSPPTVAPAATTSPPTATTAAASGTQP